MTTSTWARLAFLVSAAVMVLDEAAGVRILPLLPRGHFGFFDLKIYRDAARAVLNGRRLYSARFQTAFGFTYPPFAALLFLPLRVLGVRGDEIAATAVNLGLLVLACRLAVELTRESASSRGSASSRTPTSELTREPADRSPNESQTTRVWLVATVAVWAEPVISTVSYGQIDLLVLVLVLGDLIWLGNSRWGGLGVGIAAAIKLTPLVFLPYLLLSGRTRMTARAAAAFIASLAVSFAVLPRDAWDYWTDAVFHTSRVTGTSALASHQRYPGRGPADQSLHGALLRLFAGRADISELWVLACLLIGGSGLCLAVLAARRGDEALGFVLTAVTGVLVSPVSWDHHWVIATPGLLLLAGAGRGRLARRVTTAVAIGVTLGSSALILMLRNTGARLDLGQMLLGNLYVLLGIAAILAAGAAQLARLSARRGAARTLPAAAPERSRV